MWFRFAVVGVACVGVLGARPGAVDAGKARAKKPAWDVPAFAADPRALLDAAAALAIEPQHDAVILLEEARFRLASDGSATKRFRRIVKVLRPEGVDRWGKISTGWAQWYQQQPSLRARVITPDGEVHALDPNTIEVAPASSGSEHIYSDHRSVRAPFPAVGVGAIVELELVTADTAPFFVAGDIGNFYFRASVPIRTARLIIDAPKSLSVRTAQYLAPDGLRVRKQTLDGRVRTTYEATDVAPDAEVESRLPGDLPRFARVAFSTGSSWRAVAAAYERIVEQQIADGGIAGAITGLPARGGDRDATVAAVLAVLNDNVRYSGLEFGRSSIVPWTPAETWKRRYGDCKDKATLLVAMLREVGIEAHVALLNAGIVDRDVDPSLPGMGHFDHAIVRVAGAKPIWIDPTSEYARAGELPINDQGRWALIAAADTKALVRTPVASASDTVFRETRDVQLAERGAARIVEVSQLTGWYEQKYRYDYRDSSPKETRELLERYAKSEYLTEQAVAVSHSDVGDLSKPFELRIEVPEASRAFTDANEAVVWVLPQSLANELPDELIDADGNKPPRTQPALVLPFTRRIDYRIAIPAGFAAHALPPAQRIEIGAGTLTTSYRVDGDKVLASLQLDSGPLRYSAAQVMAARKAIRELNKAGAVKIVLEQIGEAHLTAGRVGDAIAEFRRLIALHPKESLHHQQLAYALLEAGLGKQARDEARRAIELDSKSVDAHALLGWVLQHDSIGRRLTSGADRAGAEKAYRKGIALDGKVDWVRGNLAIMLDHGYEARPYGGELDKAIVEYHALRKHTDSSTYDINLLEALLYAGRFEELVATARGMPSSQTAAALRVAAAAAHGAAKARDEELRQLDASASDRAAILLKAGEYLLKVRRYAAAAEVFSLSAAGASDAQLQARVALFARTRAVDEPPYPLADARRPVGELFMLFARDEAARWDDMRRIFTRRIGALPGGEIKGVAAIADMRTAARTSGLSEKVLIDIVFGMMDASVEDAGGRAWRVELRARPPMPPELGTFYVVKEGKHYKLLGTHADGTLAGALALELLRDGNSEQARTLLGWVADDVAKGKSTNATQASAFETIWQQKQLEERERLELAAAALAAAGGYGKPALSTLAKCPDEPAALQVACTKAELWSRMMTNDHAAALAHAEALVGAEPDNDYWHALRGYLLTRLGRASELRALAAARLAADPNSTLARRLLGSAAIVDGELAQAFQEYERVVAGKDVDAEDWNNVAWLGLFVGDTGDDVLDAARRAVAATERKNDAPLHTLAAVYAARGEYALARQIMLESMTVADAREPRPQDWLVHGRIAAGYGYAADARAAYKRVRPSPDGERANTVYALARKWQAELDASPTKARSASGR